MEKPPGKHSRSGKYCVVYGCSYTSHNGVIMHYFPHKNPELLIKWIDFVRRGRPDWVPNTFSVICSAHFADDCYPIRYKLQQQLTGSCPKGKKLLDHAFPTLDLDDEASFSSDLLSQHSKKRKLSYECSEVRLCIISLLKNRL